MSVAEQLAIIKENLKDYPNVRLIAATKYFDIAKTREIVEAGVTDIGENRKDVFLEKYEALKDLPITWHFFGTIKIPPKLSPSFIDSIDYLHSLDSIDLANAINKTRKKAEPLNCFVQVNLSGNANKTGLTETKIIPFIKNLAKYNKIKIVGLMTVVYSFDDDVLTNYFNILEPSNDSNRSRWAFDRKWKRFIGEVKPIRLYRIIKERNIDTIKMWVVKQVMPSLSTIMQAEDSLDWIVSEIFANQNRLSPRHIRLIDEYKAG